MKRIRIGAFASVSVLAMGVYGTAARAAPDATSVGEVVVTGTLLHGVAPTGGEIATVSGADLAQLGVVDTSQLLSALPQDAQFNNRPQVGGFSQFQTVNAPLLRYLGGNSAGSNSTLLLLDGVRLPGMGVQQTSADIDAIAPGALARVDVVPDGGSATYGSDAVGGVVNLITRKRFDGLEIGGHFGGAANYGQYDLNLTAGKVWDKASAWFSYDYTEHNTIENGDRRYIHDLNYTTTPFTGNSQSCNPGNFTVKSKTYPIANGAPTVGPANTCDTSTTKTFFPGESRHSVMVGFDYDLTSWLTFDLRGYYMHRDAFTATAPGTFSGVPANASVNGQSLTGTTSGVFVQSPFDNRGHTTLDTYGVIPRLDAKLWHDWRMDAFVNVAEGDAQYESRGGADATQFPNEVASGAFNPFTGVFANTADGQSAEAYQAAYTSYSKGKDDIVNSRVVFDGPLFSLPAGEIRAAVGGEYMHEHFVQINGNAESSAIGGLPAHPVSRSITSGFYEVSVPIVSEKNHVPLIDSLTVSAAGRYDDYSDFGGTFNPKYGVSLKPVDWWTLRADWGTSFQAPSLASTASAIPTTINGVAANYFGGNPAYPDTAGKELLILFPGGGVDLQPQKATTWEIGTDIRPPAIPGLFASATYYNIDFINRIGTPAFYLASFYTQYPDSYIMNTPSAPLTSAQIQKYLSSAYNIAQFSQYINNPSSVYALENGLSQNLASTTTSGLDFNIDYQRPVSFGSVFGGVSGTYIFTFNSKKTPVGAIQGLNANNVSRLRLSTNVGANLNDVFGGDLLAKATWNMTGAYEVPGTKGDFYQSKVAMFSTLNLAFVYTPKVIDGPMKGMSFTLNVDNLLDTDPPYFNGTNGNSYGYGDFTLGRFVEVGARKKF